MSRPITLPGWMTRKPKARNYVTTTGGDWHPGDVALAFAWCIRMDGTADALRKLARRLVDKVCREHQPNMKLLSRTLDDDKVWSAALKIVNRVCDMWKVAPGVPFERTAPPAPTCHYQPMRLADEPGARLWRCHYCDSTQPVNY